VIAMKKTKSSLSSLKTVIPPQPLVKEYINKNAEIERLIETHLKHIPHTSVQSKLVYLSENESKRKYRVNWLAPDVSRDNFVTSSRIVFSEMVEVTEAQNGYKISIINQKPGTQS
jgi:hypothetical protein